MVVSDCNVIGDGRVVACIYLIPHSISVANIIEAHYTIGTASYLNSIVTLYNVIMRDSSFWGIIYINPKPVLDESTIKNRSMCGVSDIHTKSWGSSSDDRAMLDDEVGIRIANVNAIHTHAGDVDDVIFKDIGALSGAIALASIDLESTIIGNNDWRVFYRECIGIISRNRCLVVMAKI